MATIPSNFSRPDKGNDAETILYEIDLLQFSRAQLLAAHALTELETFVYLEDFLLHYRNLIEFFGNPNPRPTDLTIKHPKDCWPSKQPDAETLASMTKLDLWRKYDSSKNADAISKYLHHCTKRRTVKKKWNVNEMYEELRPAIEQFQSLLPQYKASAVGLSQTRGVSMFDASTVSTRILGSDLPLKE